MSILAWSKSTNRSCHLMVAFLLVAGVLLLYGDSLQYPFVELDDPDYVVDNGDIRRINVETVRKWFSQDYVFNYIPVTMASYAIDYQIWKLNPFGYRLTNVTFHFLL